MENFANNFFYLTWMAALLAGVRFGMHWASSFKGEGLALDKYGTNAVVAAVGILIVLFAVFGGPNVVTFFIFCAYLFYTYKWGSDIKKMNVANNT